MNEQLRKAIEEATRVQVLNDGFCHDTVDVIEHEAALAKLLRVIELLVQQRDDALDHAATSESNFIWQQGHLNAELIVALEREGEGM